MTLAVGTEVLTGRRAFGGEGAVYAEHEQGSPPRRVAEVTSSIDIMEVRADDHLFALATGFVTTTSLHTRDVATEIDATWQDTTNPADLSPDGRTLVFCEGGQAAMVTSGYVGYLRRPDGAVVRLGEGMPLALSPDGGAVLVLDPLLLKLSVVQTGAGAVAALATGDLRVQTAWWFPDGKRILLAAAEPGRKERLWILPPGGRAVPITAEGESALRRQWPLSPDGTRLALADGAELRVIEVETGKLEKRAPLRTGEWLIRWYADGRSWIVARRNGDTIELLRAGPDGKRTSLATVRPSRPGASIQDWYLRVTADGRSWAFPSFSMPSRAWEITLAPVTVPK